MVPKNQDSYNDSYSNSSAFWDALKTSKILNAHHHLLDFNLIVKLKAAVGSKVFGIYYRWSAQLP